jgi:hypothetical protein
MHKLAECGASPDTKSAYSKAMLHFAKFAKSILPADLRGVGNRAALFDALVEKVGASSSTLLKRKNRRAHWLQSQQVAPNKRQYTYAEVCRRARMQPERLEAIEQRVQSGEFSYDDYNHVLGYVLLHKL